MFILAFAQPTYADAYKWVDDAGQVHFSQHPPVDYEADKIKTRSGPKVEPAQSQQAVDAMIEQQVSDEKSQQENEQLQQQEAEKAKALSKNCEIAKNNLDQYQNNPRGRYKNAAGEYIRVDENDRQEKIKQLLQDIEKYCQ